MNVSSASTQPETGHSTTYLQAIPHRNGFLVHALADQPENRGRVQLGYLVVYGTALCGAQGYGGWRLQGGHLDESNDLVGYLGPAEFGLGNASEQWLSRCAKCDREHQKLAD